MSKISTYCQFKYSLESEIYLDVILWKRHATALARFRCSNHRLGIECQRGKIARNNRLCKFCLNLNLRKIEDEYHFLLECQLYEHLRSYYTLFNDINVSYFSFLSIMKTKNTEHLRQLGSYVYRAMQVHKEFNASFP